MSWERWRHQEGVRDEGGGKHRAWLPENVVEWHNECWPPLARSWQKWFEWPSEMEKFGWTGSQAKTRHPIRTWRWTVSEQGGQNNIVCPTANARIIFSLLQSGISPSIKLGFRKRLRCNFIMIVSQLHFLKQVNRFPLYRLTGWLWTGATSLRIRYHQSFSVSIGDKR